MNTFSPFGNFGSLGGLFPACSGPIADYATGEHMCTICDLFSFIMNIVFFIQFWAPFVAGMIIGYFAIKTLWGIMMDRVSDLKELRSIAIDILIGFLLIYGATILVNTLISLIYGGSINPFSGISCATFNYNN
jgi:hypothetical protein